MAELYQMGDRVDEQRRITGGPARSRRSFLPIQMLIPLMGIAAIACWHLGDLPGLRPQKMIDYESVSASFHLCNDSVMTDCVSDAGHFVYHGQYFTIGDVIVPTAITPACTAEAALATKGSMRLLALLNGGAFEMRPDIRPTDPAGRKLRILSRDGVSFGQLLTMQGVARASGSSANWCA